MDARLTDYRVNKRSRKLQVIYCVNKRFYEISDILTIDGYKVSIDSIFSKAKTPESKEPYTEIVINVTLKRKSIDGFIDHLLKEEKCKSVSILDAKEFDHQEDEKDW